MHVLKGPASTGVTRHRHGNKSRAWPFRSWIPTPFPQRFRRFSPPSPHRAVVRRERAGSWNERGRKVVNQGLSPSLWLALVPAAYCALGRWMSKTGPALSQHGGRRWYSPRPDGPSPACFRPGSTSPDDYDRQILNRRQQRRRHSSVTLGSRSAKSFRQGGPGQDASSPERPSRPAEVLFEHGRFNVERDRSGPISWCLTPLVSAATCLLTDARDLMRPAGAVPAPACTTGEVSDVP